MLQRTEQRFINKVQQEGNCEKRLEPSQTGESQKVENTENQSRIEQR